MSELKPILWLGYVQPTLRACTSGRQALARNVSRQLRSARHRLAELLESGPLASPPPGLTIEVEATELSGHNTEHEELDLRRHVRPFSHASASARDDDAHRG